MKLAFIPSTFLPWVGGAEIQDPSGVYDVGTGQGNLIKNLIDFVNIDNKKIKIVTLNKILINFVFLLRYYLNINFN